MDASETKVKMNRQKIKKRVTIPLCGRIIWCLFDKLFIRNALHARNDA